MFAFLPLIRTTYGAVALCNARAAFESDGANHQSVVTPTGNAYLACIPRNSIVVDIGWGSKLVDALSSQFKTTMEYLDQSLEEARPVT